MKGLLIVKIKTIVVATGLYEIYIQKEWGNTNNLSFVLCHKQNARNSYEI